ncbi:hypothetical protein LAZ67_22000693, partial [Cordylochernes scorpioides]
MLGAAAHESVPHVKGGISFGANATETYELIKEAFGDAALSRSRTFEWFSSFQKGWEKVNDDQHTGRPRSLRWEENKLKIKELIKFNRRISIKDLSSETGLSVRLCHQIATKDLDMIRTSSKFVPRILTEEQKEVRMDVCKNMVEMTRTDPEWMQKIITGDETWVYQYDPETKRQSSQWIERGEPKPKRARFTKSKQPKLLKYLIKHSPMTPQREQLFLNGILDLKLAEFSLKMILVKDAQNFKRLMKMCKKITDLIKENPRTTLLELEQDTGISKTTIGRIVTEDLKLKNTPAKFIPRFLTNEQKLCRLATCEDMLEMTGTDPEWKDKIITGDETWVYGYDPETKRQSAEWRGQGEPRPKKSRILKSRNKVLLVAFFLDNKGIFHHEYLPAGQTVIKEMSLGILRRL